MDQDLIEQTMQSVQAPTRGADGQLLKEYAEFLVCTNVLCEALETLGAPLSAEQLAVAELVLATFFQGQFGDPVQWVHDNIPPLEGAPNATH